MYYVVIDLEWNQYHNPLRTPTSRAGVKMHEEIIQIGAVKVDHQMNPVDTFKMYVRLGSGRRLDRYVKKLTHITESDIASGEDFPMAAPEFAKWLKDVDAIFSWGPDDRRVYLNNLAFHSLEAPACPWFDAQKIYSAQKPDHGSLGLKSVAESKNIYVNLSLHDALNDAILTAFCMTDLDIQKGIDEYGKPRKENMENGEAEPIATAKTHRHSTQQAAWEEACVSLLRCPDCMQTLEWSGEEVGTLEKWYKSAECKTHGEYIIRGEFIGQKYSVVKFSFFKPTDEVKEMVQKLADPPAKKRRRRKRKKSAAPTAESLTPEDTLSKAIAFAAEKHKQQTRTGALAPYIVHPMEAAAIASTMTDDMLVIAAAVLHDTIGNCEGVTQEVIETQFGAHVADLVAFDVSEDSADSRKEMKQSALEKLSGADEEQLIITLSDELSNARSMKRDFDAIGDELFKRHNEADKKAYEKYYRSLTDALKSLDRFPAYKEFASITEAMFGKQRKRTARKPKNTEKHSDSAE
ncbi:MAG: HD domain-containing protein [Clostridia bacterium]|nr:HD domain-containing protein [Clostridia bacterium]